MYFKSEIFITNHKCNLIIFRFQFNFGSANKLVEHHRGFGARNLIFGELLIFPEYQICQNTTKTKKLKKAEIKYQIDQSKLFHKKMV